MSAPTFPLPIKWRVPTFSLPFKGVRAACLSGTAAQADRTPGVLRGAGRAGAGMVFTTRRRRLLKPDNQHHPHPTLPLKGRASTSGHPVALMPVARTQTSLRYAEAAPLFSLPFKGRAGVGMVVTTRSRRPLKPDNQRHPHPTLPLKGRASTPGHVLQPTT